MYIVVQRDLCWSKRCVTIQTNVESVTSLIHMGKIENNGNRALLLTRSVSVPVAGWFFVPVRSRFSFTSRLYRSTSGQRTMMCTITSHIRSTHPRRCVSSHM